MALGWTLAMDSHPASSERNNNPGWLGVPLGSAQKIWTKECCKEWLATCPRNASGSFWNSQPQPPPWRIDSSDAKDCHGGQSCYSPSIFCKDPRTLTNPQLCQVSMRPSLMPSTLTIQICVAAIVDHPTWALRPNSPLSGKCRLWT